MVAGASPVSPKCSSDKADMPASETPPEKHTVIRSGSGGGDPVTPSIAARPEWVRGSGLLGSSLVGGTGGCVLNCLADAQGMLDDRTLISLRAAIRPIITARASTLLKEAPN